MGFSIVLKRKQLHRHRLSQFSQSTAWLH